MKEIVGVAISRLLLSTVFGFALALGMGSSIASAQSISTNTQQLLPPGGNSCQQIVATSFTPFIYNDSLDSFEFTVPDSSYVALVGNVGGQPVSFQYMSRQIDASGKLRVHVDINSTKLIGTLPIQITLLSAKTGAPVCAAVVSISLGSGPVQNTYVPPAASTPTPPSTGDTSSYPSQSYGGEKAGGSSVGSGSKSGSGSSSANSSSLSASATTESAVGSMQKAISGMCATTTGAYRLWLVLLVLYVLLIGTLLWAEWPLSWAWVRMPEWIAAGILVPLVVLLGFWYFSVGCRGTWWIPLVALVIALAGLAAAFWDNPRVARILLIEAGETS